MTQERQTQRRKGKGGKRFVQTNSIVTSLWAVFGLSTLNLKMLVNQVGSNQGTSFLLSNKSKHYFCFSFISGTFGNKRKAASSKEHECVTAILFRTIMPAKHARTTRHQLTNWNATSM